jgi:hypothetical protein
MAIASVRNKLGNWGKHVLGARIGCSAGGMWLSAAPPNGFTVVDLGPPQPLGHTHVDIEGAESDIIAHVPAELIVGWVKRDTRSPLPGMFGRVFCGPVPDPATVQRVFDRVMGKLGSPVIVAKRDNNGSLLCTTCTQPFPYAEPAEDGSFVCYGCRVEM